MVYAVLCIDEVEGIPRKDVGDLLGLTGHRPDQRLQADPFEQIGR